MKITGELISKNHVALRCKPMFREAFVVYATILNGEWMLNSGRYPSSAQLDAIDRIYARLRPSPKENT